MRAAAAAAAAETATDCPARGVASYLRQPAASSQRRSPDNRRDGKRPTGRPPRLL